MLNLAFIFAVCINSLTLSIGAHEVLAIAPETPPDKKSRKNWDELDLDDCGGAYIQFIRNFYDIIAFSQMDSQIQ